MENKRKKHSNNVQNENKIKHTIDINITQMMVGKQWVKGRYIYRWAGETSTQVKEASSNKGWGR